MSVCIRWYACTAKWVRLDSRAYRVRVRQRSRGLVPWGLYQRRDRMRKMRKLLVFAIMALTVTAVMAPSAFAQTAENHETLEVKSETTGNHCPAIQKPSAHVVTGGCLIHATSTGEVELRKHVFGIESHIVSCENEFWGRVNEDAEGYIVHQRLIGHPAGTTCSRIPCKENAISPPSPWPAHGDEDSEGGPFQEGEEKLEVIFCVEANAASADETCEIDIPFNTLLGAHHRQEFGHEPQEMPGHGVGGFRCELEGHWITESLPTAGGPDTEENITPGGSPETEVEVNHRTKVTEDPAVKHP
jgi:hypothetical protein